LNTKNFFASKVIQGVLAAGLGIMLPKLHIPVVDTDVQGIASNVLTIAGFAWGIYGRASVPGFGLRIGSVVLSSVVNALESLPPPPASQVPASSSASGPVEATPVVPAETPAVVAESPAKPSESPEAVNA
jgi:hypothetical protein